MLSGKVLKVLMVTPENPANLVGGLGTYIRELSFHLKENLNVKVLYLDIKNEVLEGRIPQFVDFVVKTKMTYPSTIPEVNVLDEAHFVLSNSLHIFTEFMPDIIHCNDRYTYLAFRYFNNVLYTSHLLFTDMVNRPALDEQITIEHKIENLALRDANLVVTVSQFQKKIIKNRIEPKSRPIVLPLGANLSSFYHSERKSEQIKIAFFGRFDYYMKGFDLFLESAITLKEIYKEKISIRAYGKGDFPNEYPDDVLDYVGFLNEENKYEILSEIDIIIMPSRYEPFGLSGLEALSFGAILLCQSGLGMDEFLISNQNYLEINLSVESIVDKAKEIIENPSFFKSIRESALSTADNWSWKKSSKYYIAAYQSMVYSIGEKIDFISSKKAQAYYDKYSNFWKKIYPTLAVIDPCLVNKLSESFVDLSRFYKTPELEFCFDFWECLPLHDNSIENLIANQILEFSYEPTVVLRELLRVTKECVYLIVNKGVVDKNQRVAFDSAVEIEEWLNTYFQNVEVKLLNDEFESKQILFSCKPKNFVVNKVVNNMKAKEGTKCVT